MPGAGRRVIAAASAQLGSLVRTACRAAVRHAEIGELFEVAGRDAGGGQPVGDRLGRRVWYVARVTSG